MTKDREQQAKARLGPRPVAVLRKALQSRGSAPREAMSMPERELQDRLDDGSTEGTGCPRPSGHARDRRG